MCITASITQFTTLSNYTLAQGGLTFPVLACGRDMYKCHYKHIFFIFYWMKSNHHCGKRKITCDLWIFYAKIALDMLLVALLHYITLPWALQGYSFNVIFRKCIQPSIQYHGYSLWKVDIVGWSLKGQSCKILLH